jgi:hypothetical protein
LTSSMALELLERFLFPWKKSLEDAAGSQSTLLRSLLQEYAKTEYGGGHGASEVEGMLQYRRRFPVLRYQDLKPLINRVAEGEYHALLSERPLAWVMTRGSTGRPKLFPIAMRHIQEILSCGARAIVSCALNSGDLGLLQGVALNLTLPSRVGELKTKIEGQEYGYSSGVYAKLNPQFQGLKLIPDQREIDEAGSDLTVKGWERRFECIYQVAKEADLRVVIGVAPVQVSFARYLKRTHGIYPKDLWKVRAVFPTSVAKIQTRYKPVLERLYGKVYIGEMYTATEGAFAQQKDSLPYVMPNYDTYLFEVFRGGRFKMLHELSRGEWGRLIVSTSMLPRYDLGDYVEAMGKGYFRVFGRAKRTVLAEHLLYRLFLGWLT